VTRGGDAQWTGVQWSAFTRCEEKQWRGVSVRRRSKRGSSSVGPSPYSRTRRWPRVAKPVGGKAMGGQGGGHSLDTVGAGGAVVRTGQLTDGPQRFHIFPNYPNQLKLGN
jgi:hypothetical protein